MAKRPGHLGLIKRAHWRWVVWSVIESAGVGAALGVAVGLLMVVVLMWQGEAAVMPALVSMGVGAAAGVIWGGMHRPSELQTAMLIDRQMGLADLLSSSLLPQTWGDKGFARIVRDQADAASERISSNELILRRLGSRQWGGIGLAAAMMLTLAMMSAQVPPTQAHSESASSLVITKREPALKNEKRTQTENQGAPNRQQHLINTKDTESQGEQSGQERSFMKAATSHQNTSGSDGFGFASSRSEQARIEPLRQNVNSGYIPDGTDTTSGGAGASVESGGNGTATGSSQSSSATAATPLWQTQTWPADVAATLEKLGSGQIPDPYRDMVREYFTPSSK